MIKKVELYTAICDNCGIDSLEEDDISGWNDIIWLESGLEESGWYVGDGKHYCPDCFSRNENGELVLKTPHVF